jgi:DNA-binding MarR family transcriptional regulator
LQKKLKSLQAEWYKKLEEEGFVDIEKDFQFHSTKLYHAVKKDNKMIKEQETYYSKAFEFLELYDFKNITEKQIWMLHTNGESCRSIEKILNQAKYKKSTIATVIKRLKKIMMQAY